MSRDVVLIHGYSDKGASFRTWRNKLCSDPARDVKTIGIGNYQSLTDEVTIKDLPMVSTVLCGTDFKTMRGSLTRLFIRLECWCCANGSYETAGG